MLNLFFRLNEWKRVGLPGWEKNVPDFFIIVNLFNLGCSSTQTLTVLIKASPSPRIVISSEPWSENATVAKFNIMFVEIFLTEFSSGVSVTYPDFWVWHSWEGDSGSAPLSQGPFFCNVFNTKVTLGQVAETQLCNFSCKIKTLDPSPKHISADHSKNKVAFYSTSRWQTALPSAPPGQLSKARWPSTFPFCNPE